MNCKYCDAQIADDCKECPVCGESLVEKKVTQTSLKNKKPQQKKKKNSVGKVFAIIGIVIVLAVLAIFLLEQFGVKANPFCYLFKEEEETVATTEAGSLFGTYCVSEEEALARANDVVATVGDAELTNSQLQIYYRMQVWDFINYYGSYLSYMGFDTTIPLSEQPCMYDETISWEQYFVNAAIETWQSYQVLVLRAQQEGFTLSAEMEDELALLPQTLESQAMQGGYASADDMIKSLLGPANSLETYMEYVRLNALSNEYYATKYEAMTPTDEEVEAYFNENEEAFTQNGITKDGGLESSVRHILVCPKGEEGATTFTEEQWAACLTEAERILQEWKDGDATEESFIELVPLYTEDPGSSTTGGLYENINPTSSYMENFLMWAVDMSRLPGDTGIVKTEYGYHIMYFVKGEPYWLINARTQLISERTSVMLDEAREEFPLVRKDENIALVQLVFS